MSPARVALVGVGRMGEAIANRLIDCGYELSLYNRSPGRTDELEARGASVATSVRAACDGAEIVVTMLADDAALEAVTLAAGGVLESLGVDAVHVAMGTHGTATLRAIAERHVAAGRHFLAAPVLGRPLAARAGKLGVIVAGDREALAACRAVLEALARRVHDAGGAAEAAAATKLAHNFVLACAIEATGEAISLVEGYGVAPRLLHEVLVDGLFAAPAYEIYGRIMVEEDYEAVGITARLGLKDLDLVLGAAELALTPLPSAGPVRDRLLGAIAHGDGELDWSVVCREQRRASGRHVDAPPGVAPARPAAAGGDRRGPPASGRAASVPSSPSSEEPA